MTGNKIADKTAKFSKTSQQNNSEIVRNELDKKHLKKDISPEKDDDRSEVNTIV